MLISRGTAPEQPVKNPKMDKRIFTNFKNVIKFLTNFTTEKATNSRTMRHTYHENVVMGEVDEPAEIFARAG